MSEINLRPLPIEDVFSFCRDFITCLVFWNPASSGHANEPDGKGNEKFSQRGASTTRGDESRRGTKWQVRLNKANLGPRKNNTAEFWTCDERRQTLRHSLWKGASHA